jgi:hypothetical protein
MFKDKPLKPETGTKPVAKYLIDIGTDHILKLDQWNHADVLNVKKIMHQTRLYVIKFDKPGRLKQNSQIILTLMHKVRNTKK